MLGDGGHILPGQHMER